VRALNDALVLKLKEGKEVRGKKLSEAALVQAAAVFQG